jgi:hypothetical protein
VTASELAFLALGLVLGATTGAALLVVVGSRPARREIRVTMTRDAIPRRSETLSHDAFVGAAAAPAPGGPGDRRRLDRDAESGAPGGSPTPAGAPRSASPATGYGPSGRAPDRAAAGAPDRTIVPSAAPGQAGAIGIAIQPEVDRELEDLRRRPAHGCALERMLRGEHLALVEVVDAMAGSDSRRRRDWELLLGGLVEAMADVAVRESVIDFPMGTAFWDSFTIEQCRRIVGSLASMGYRYDGRTGWVDGRVPAYRDLSQALADVGLEPRRIRAWPNQGEIAGLFVGARPAPEELLAAAGPDYTSEAMQQLVGERAGSLGDLWLAWDAVRPALFAERLAPVGAARAASPPPAPEG